MLKETDPLLRWKHFIKEEGSCLVWNGYKNRGRPRAAYKGKRQYVSILVYLFHKGEILPGQVVRHSCDNPACLLPAHLIAGTQQDNIKEMYDKGRRQRLPDDIVIGIRNGTLSVQEISTSFGYSIGYLRNVKCGLRR